MIASGLPGAVSSTGLYQIYGNTYHEQQGCQRHILSNGHNCGFRT